MGRTAFAVRLRVPELMDEPGLERARHELALDALARINRVSLTVPRMWSEVRALARSGVRPVRLLDVACGGGDVLHDLSARAAREGIDVELCGCDVSAVALERARSRSRGPRPARFEQIDVLRESLPGTYHLTCSSLFLHHLADPAAIALLRAMSRATERVLLVQDLRRTRLGWVLAWLGVRLLSKSDVARADGPTSVRTAYTLEEARRLAAAAGLQRVQVRACWPQRFALRWARA